MPDYTPEELIAIYDLNFDNLLTQADVDMATTLGLPALASTIENIIATGSGGVDYSTLWEEMQGPQYQAYEEYFQTTPGGSMAGAMEAAEQAGIANLVNFVWNAFASTTSTYGGLSATKRVIDWTSFWSDTNIPVLGYDAVDDKIVVLQAADHSEDTNKDIVVLDLITMSWTRGDTKLSGSNDMTNMITAPDTGELVIAHQHNTTGILRRFKAHQPANITSSSTVDITTPFFDFGKSMAKKRLYKVEVLCHGTNLDDLIITASYDGDLGAYTNIFSSNVFANTSDDSDGDDWDIQTFTVSSPADFNNISIKISASGAMTTADWGISEISFKYREKGIR